MTSGPSSAWWRRALRELPGLGAIAFVVAAVFRSLLGGDTLLITPEGPTNISDMLNASYPFRLLLGKALAQGQLPLWTDQIFCGYPLLANPAVGTFYPVNWVFAFLPGPAAMSVTLLLTGMMAGWFTYCYSRTLGLERVPATLGGMSFAVCGWFVSHARHTALIASACWLPLQLALVEQAVRERGGAGRRAALWLAPVMAFSLWAGGVQSVYLSLLAAGTYAALRSATRLTREWRWRLLRLGTLALLVAWGMALAAVQVLPSLELSHYSERAAGLKASQADPVPMPPQDLLTLVSAKAVGRATDYSYQRRNVRLAVRGGLFWEDYLYTGLPIVVFAALALPWTLRRWPAARILLLLGVLGVLLALGERGGLYPWAFRNLPGLSGFRFPERFLLWTEFAVAGLGAMGAHVLCAWLRGRARTAISAVLLAVASVDLVVAQTPQNVYYPAREWLRPPDTVATIRSGPASRAASTQTFFAHARYGTIFMQGGWEAHRQELYTDRALLEPSANVLWDVPMVDGYAELVPEWQAQVWSSQHGSPVLVEWTDQMVEPLGGREDFPAVPPPGYTELLGAANVGYVTSRWPVKSERLQALPTRERVHLYRNLDALGRAYLISDAVNVGSDDNSLALLRAGQADFRRHVYVADKSSQGVVRFDALPVPVRDEGGLTHAVIEAEAPAPCWLVLSDAYYPGWSVTVDGSPARLERANGVMRAVQLPAGAHRVEFDYRCQPLRTGAAISGMSAVLWLAALLLLPRLPEPKPEMLPARATRRSRKGRKRRAVSRQ